MKEVNDQNRRELNWPEEIRSHPTPVQFPWLVLAQAIGSGLIILTLLSILYLWLNLQAQKEIVYYDRNGQINAIQANQANQRAITSPPFELSADSKADLNERLPLLGLPRWSPSGNRFATTVSGSDMFQVAVFSPSSDDNQLFSPRREATNFLAVPGDGWSSDGSFLALLESDGTNTFLEFVDFRQEEAQFTSFGVPVTDNAGFDWHPFENKILVSTPPNNTRTSTLQVVNVDDRTVDAFRPADRQILRADGAWSSNGESIAYISLDEGGIVDGDVSVGTLWVADAETGNNARQITQGQLNLHPFWDQSNPNLLYFTQFITSTNSFQLFQINVRPSGVQPEPQIVTQSNRIIMDHPFDRSHFINVGSNVTSNPTISDQPLVDNRGLTPYQLIQLPIRRTLPVLNAPVWSPNGSNLAATYWQNGSLQPTIFESNLEQSTQINLDENVIGVVPTSGWSANGRTVAILTSNEEKVGLTISSSPFNTDPKPIEIEVDSRAGMSWHPAQSTLLISRILNEKTELIRITDTDQWEVETIQFDDELPIHADGVWSPNGEKIAYIATNSQSLSGEILTGELWVSNSDGSQSIQLDGYPQTIAPFWSPDGTMIYYTRFKDVLGDFVLYKVPLDLSEPPQYVGPSRDNIARFPFDRIYYQDWSPQGTKLLMSGRENPYPIGLIDRLGKTDQIEDLQNSLPILGAVQFDPNRELIAATTWVNDQSRIILHKDVSSSTPPSLSPESDSQVGMIADGWSSDGRYAAFLGFDGTSTLVSIFDTAEFTIADIPQSLNTEAGLDWHPNINFLAISTFEEGITPTIRIYDTRVNSTVIFEPEDELEGRGDPAYSLNGSQIAYVGLESLDDIPDEGLFAGQIWIADSNGNNPRLLLNEGLNFAPLWDNARNRILFTQFDPEEDRFDLLEYRFDEEIIAEVGTSSRAFADYPYDRSLHNTWSPEGNRWFLPGSDTQQRLIYQVEDGSSTLENVIDNSCPSPTTSLISWIPSSRGVMISCSSQFTQLRWLESTREDSSYPFGIFPTWQP